MAKQPTTPVTTIVNHGSGDPKKDKGERATLQKKDFEDEAKVKTGDHTSRTVTKITVDE